MLIELWGDNGQPFFSLERTSLVKIHREMEEYRMVIPETFHMMSRIRALSDLTPPSLKIALFKNSGKKNIVGVPIFIFDRFV